MAVSDIVTAGSQRYSVMIKIDGVGQYYSAANLSTHLNSDGRNRYCTSVPDYAASNATITGSYLDYMQAPPEELSLRAKEFGGIPDIGELSFSLVDVADHLRGTLRIEADAVDQINETATLDDGGQGLTDTDTTVTVRKGSQWATGDLCWIGAECLAIDSVSSNDLTVRRGYAGTTAEEHRAGAQVFNYIPFLRGRMVTMSLVEQDGAGASEETNLGSWSIDSVSWDEAMNVWTFSCSSRMRALSKLAPFNNLWQGEVLTELGSTTAFTSFEVNMGNAKGFDQQWGNTVGLGGYWLIDEKEVVSDYGIAYSGIHELQALRLYRRGCAGTRPMDVDPGAKIVRVLAADKYKGGCSFRWAPGPSPQTSRASPGNWKKSSHWIDIILNLLTSGTTKDLVGSNYDSTHGNWACLPTGFGLGIDITELDMTSFMDIKRATLQWNFDHFIFGHERRPFGEILEEEFLKPLGAHLGWDRENGKITINFPSVPLSGTSTLSLGNENLLMREVGPNNYLPDWDVSFPLSAVVGAVGYEVGWNGVFVTVRDQGAAARLRAGYEGDAAPIIFRVKGVNPENASFFEALAMDHLAKNSKPRMHVMFRSDMKTWNAQLGALIDMDLPGVPNLSDGTSGHTDVLCDVQETSIVFDTQANGEVTGVHMNNGVKAWTSKVNVARIAPSARINSSITDNMDGTYTFTIKSGVYASTDTHQTYAADVDGFEVNDEVMIYNIDGTRVSTTVQTITAISNNDITLDGNFGGSLTNSLFLRFTNSKNATADQLSEHTFMGDFGDFDVPTGNALYFWGTI